MDVDTESSTSQKASDETNNYMAPLFFNELCENSGDRLIAYSPHTGEMICNRCLYKRDDEEFMFTSKVAKQVSQNIKSKYNEFSVTFDKLQQIEPDKVRHTILDSIDSCIDEICDEIDSVKLDKICKSVKNMSVDCQAMNDELKRSEDIKNHVDKHSSLSHFTQLAREEENIRKQISNRSQLGGQIERYLQESSKLYQSKREELKNAKRAFEAAINDLSQNHLKALDTGKDGLFVKENN